MTESLSGLTAAALAVVMLATALPDLKEIYDSIVPDYPPGEVCSVCHDPGCPYFYDGTPGIWLKGEHIDSDDGLYVPYDLYHMNGINEETYGISAVEENGITTRNLERLIFRLDYKACRDAWGARAPSFTEYRTSTLWNDGSTDDRSGVIFTLESIKSEEYLGYLLAFLVYAPDGLPGFDPELPYYNQFGDLIPRGAETEFRAIDVPGFPDAQIHLYSDMGSAFLDTVEQNCTVDVVPALATQKLGKTMQLQETENLFRAYSGGSFSGRTQRAIITNGKQESLRVFFADYSTAEFNLRSKDSIGDMVIYMLPEVPGQDWTILMERYYNLNDTAPKSSHEVCFPLLHLDTLTVNGITYDCWMPYMQQDEFWNSQFFFIPQHEPTVMLCHGVLMSNEELTLIRQDSRRYFEEYMPYLIDRLNQISLR